MLKMLVLFLFLLCAFCLQGLTKASQETVLLINLNDPTPMVLQALSHSGSSVAVSVHPQDLTAVSSSVLKAERWVRTHVLSHFPSIKITTIVVGNGVLCNKEQEEKWGLVLPSVKNIYHSLKRWGLEKEIKVSATFSQECLSLFSDRFRDDLSDNVIKPLLRFLQKSNSSYSVKPSLHTFSPSLISLVSSHRQSIKNLGFHNLSVINVLLSRFKEQKPIKRKLSFMNSKALDPFPTKPTPSLSVHSSIGYSVPAPIPTYRYHMTPQIALPPSISRNYPPLRPPLIIPTYPPDIPTLPPCNSKAEPPESKGGGWCVAKPNVPEETLQEAIDYACGEGGGDCEEIGKHGSCYDPNTVIAHASYAFNSYWQKKKNYGGTCDFGGTAMIINSDPSFMRCQFIVS
ncbi:Carbohydrate-binding x8 domain-containing protein [Thalictrum thalictroides]|uniref:Carbohydrate-binding x8 domain-containing protein n=1 Tax=Thalictrum thalictroides TaxID=46969 RepID=A0A7J6WB26_THATH|nr:Carbohydrate-binding x8 domain-containing protein [Thalictrum thalictroides]